LFLNKKKKKKKKKKIGFNIRTTHVICGSVLEQNKERERERERERENTNEKDMSQTKKERKARDGCFPLSKGMRN
jgi:hypothetical protein